MPTANTRPRRQVVQLTIAASTDWQIVTCPSLGTSGILVAATYRLGTEGAPVGGDLEVKVIDGAYEPGLPSASIASIADEHVAYHESAITLAASATSAAKTNIEDLVGESSVYDTVGGRSREEASRTRANRLPLLAVRGDGVLEGTVVIALRAKDAGA